MSSGLRRRPQIPPGYGNNRPPQTFVAPPGTVVSFADLVRRYGAVRSQPAGFRGLGGPASHRGANSGFPLPNGTPGSFVSPYDESDGVWGPGGGVGAPIDASSPVPVPSADGSPATGADGISIPFGQSLTPWQNPTTFQSVPLLQSTPTNTPVLSANLARNALLIQNGSTATSPDIAPILYVGFNSQAIANVSLAIYPNGGAVLFDIICPRDSIYVLFANGSGASQVFRGAVLQGTKVT